MLLPDNFPKEFATARAKLAAAATELDIVIGPFVNVCKVLAHSGQFKMLSWYVRTDKQAIHKGKKKMALDDALNASTDSEQLNRFTPLLVQLSVLEALLAETQVQAAVGRSGS